MPERHEDDGLEVSYRIPVERFRYEDELNDRNQKLQKRNHTLQVLIVVLSVVTLFIGWGLGSFQPIPFFNNLRHGVTYITQQDSEEKVSHVMNVMKRYWYFSRGIENIEERLTDQALIGMTSNEEDPHTAYMSKEEIESFTQGINRNFVGIGVQFTNLEDGLHLITRVFRDSPAEKAGVQAGDIIHSVDGIVTDHMTSQEIKDLVQGEEGTVVTIVFQREGQYVTLDIVRGQVGHTVDGMVMDNHVGYIAIEQFGETTETETREFLDEFMEEEVESLVLDLRDDGGGYLETLKDVVSLFLPSNKTFIRREYTDGTADSSKTSVGPYVTFSPIVILVNENTASAAEAFTLGMKENRDDVTVIGVTTYGKGSVQVTQYFDDGSALKYTDSIWKSPKGLWINGTGIEPDETVELHEVLNSSYDSMEEDAVFRVDSVSEFVREAQLCLDFLGYEPGRMDGYFSEATLDAIHRFEEAYDLSQADVLNSDVYESLISAVIHEWTVNDETDTQLQRALELIQETQGIELETEEGEALSLVLPYGSAVMVEPIEVPNIRIEEDDDTI